MTFFNDVCEKKDRVIIRVWASGLSGGEGSGHVSIEVPSLRMNNPNYVEGDDNLPKEIPLYVSLWPEKNVAHLFQKSTFFPIKPQFMLNYEEDYKAEGKCPPETCICLYSLKPHSIRDMCKKIYGGYKLAIKDNKEIDVQVEEDLEKVSKSNFKGWVLIGGNWLINRNSGESCASLAYRLLVAGGIYDLIPKMYSSNFSLVVTPDALAKAVNKAKTTEIKKYPETKGFVFPGETKVEKIKDESTQQKKKKCLMM